MPCNLQSPKAQDPDYICNQVTNRWNRRNTSSVRPLPPLRAPRPLPRARIIEDEENELNIFTLYLLSSMPFAKLKRIATKHKIHGRSTRDRKVLEGLIQDFITAGASMPVGDGGRPPSKNNTPWWKKCENEETLQGEEWKDLHKEEVVSFGKYCFTLPEIFSIIHRELTSTDTSYQVPPLRLQVPRDPYTRKPFPLEFMKHVRGKISAKIIPTFHDVMFFFHYLEQFYRLDVVKKVLAGENSVSKAKLSMDIEKFLTTSSNGRMDYLECDRRDPRNVKWHFRHFRHIPRNALSYVRGEK